MDAIKSWAKLVYYILTMTLIVGGMVYQFGFKVSDEQAFRDKAARELDAANREIKRIAEIQTVRIKELEQTKSDVEKLKWESARIDKTLEDIRFEQKDQGAKIQDVREKISVILELLKPKH